MIYFSDGRGTLNLGFQVLKICREMSLRQVEQGFSSFFLAYLMIFQSDVYAEGAAEL